MCGIVGMISLKSGGFWNTDLDQFQEMLYVDALRGPDSTGAFCVHRHGKITGIKHASNPFNTFSSNGWKDFRSDAVASGRVLIGHNRKATHGTINNNNSHPFYEDHIVLVHNGMLTNHKNKLADREVDSHAMAAAISETEPESIPQLIADVDGAYAFVWWDMNQEKLFFVRNEARPLNIMRTKDMIYLASEIWMARGVAIRNLKNLTTNDIQMFEVKPGVLFSIDLKGTMEEIELPKKVVTPVQSTTTGVQATTVHHGTTNTNTNGTHNTHVTTPFNKDNTGALVLPFEKTSLTLPFKRGEEIMVQLVSATSRDFPNGSRRLQVTGKVRQLAKPSIDVSGLLPDGVDIGDVQDWLGKLVQCRIMDILPSLAAGPSLRVLDFQHVSRHARISWNNITLHQVEWEWIEANCKCKHCNASPQPFERLFTNVKINKNDNVEVICADCIEGRIADENIKDSFIKRRVQELDSWVPKQEQQ